MELTTRCPECETEFCVSLEQLRLRKGYIRCVQCATIFDGFDAVVPSATPATPATKAALASEGAAPVAPAPKPFVIPPEVSAPPASAGATRPFSIGAPKPPPAPVGATEPSVGATHLPPETSVPYIGTGRTASAERDAREPRLPSVLRERGATGGAQPPEVGHPKHPPAGEDSGDFLFIEPRSRTRATHPRAAAFSEGARGMHWMTPVWAVLALCGLVLLVVQGVYVYRAQLANAFPGLRPTLEAACAYVSCTVPYDRQIDAIAITGSALRASGAPEGDASSLTLEVTLRNTFERPQEWPTLVLDLKDASGTIVVRRNLPPQTWVPPALRSGPFAAGADLTVQVPLTLRGVQANGYQLDKFFP